MYHNSKNGLIHDAQCALDRLRQVEFCGHMSFYEVNFEGGQSKVDSPELNGPGQKYFEPSTFSLSDRVLSSLKGTGSGELFFALKFLVF